MVVKIRLATKKDYPLIYDCMITTGWNDVPEEEKASTRKEVWQSFFRDIAKTLVQRRGRKIFVAYDDENDFMGYVMTGRMGNGVIPVGMIFDIFVLEPFRRRGIGRILIRTAERYCKEQGMRRIKLEVADNNPVARDLYKKMGFRDERHLMGKNLS
ncbi:MAG: GNAT family N-acetyltransferase [Thermoplasmata archaeon]